MIGEAFENPVALVGLAFSIVSVVLGLGVAYIAIRGYLRNRQRPMLFVAVGIALVLWVPLVTLLGLALPSADRPIVFTVAAASQALGLLSILYGLWTPRSADAPGTD